MASLRRVSIGLGGLLLALALGLGSLWWGVKRPTGGSAWIRNGVWETGREVGSAATDPYSRARVAIYGLWALPPEAVVYYIASTDEQGEPLSVRCRYDILGESLPARWWSISVYRDFHYIDTPARRYSRSSSAMVDSPDGRFTIRLDADGRGENGLPMGTTAGVITLNLRLYQPDPGVREARASLRVPRIERRDCDA